MFVVERVCSRNGKIKNNLSILETTSSVVVEMLLDRVTLEGVSVVFYRKTCFKQP